MVRGPSSTPSISRIEAAGIEWGPQFMPASIWIAVSISSATSGNPLLHAALRQVVGDHVQQKGSLVSPERLRFDISHYEKVSPEQLKEVEGQVQDWILLDQEIAIHDDIPIDEAKDRGAMALFGEKYGDRVRMVEIGDFSIELCGGIHCAHTGEIGPMMITGEGSVSSGVRRVEALTGAEGARRMRENEDLIQDLALLMKSSVRSREVASPPSSRRIVSSVKAAAGLVQSRPARGSGGGHGQRIPADPGRWWFIGATHLRTSFSWLDSPRDARATGLRLARPGKMGSLHCGTSEEVPMRRVHCGKIAKMGAESSVAVGWTPDMAQAGGKAGSAERPWGRWLQLAQALLKWLLSSPDLLDHFGRQS